MASSNCNHFTPDKIHLWIEKKPLIEAAQWTSRENFYLFASVFNYGTANNWELIAEIVKKKGELYRPAEWYTARNCKLQYNTILKNQSKEIKSMKTSEMFKTIKDELLQKYRADVSKTLNNYSVEYFALLDSYNQTMNLSKNESTIQLNQLDKQAQKDEADCKKYYEQLMQMQNGMLSSQNSSLGSSSEESFNWTPSAAKVKSILNSCDAVHAKRDKTVMSLSASSYTTPGKFSPLIDRSMQGEVIQIDKCNENSSKLMNLHFKKTPKVEEKTDYIQDTNYVPEDQDHFDQGALSLCKKAHIIKEIDNFFTKELNFDIDQSKSLSDFHDLAVEVVKTDSPKKGLHTEIKKQMLQDNIEKKTENMEVKKSNTEDFELEIMRRFEEKKAKEFRMMKQRETKMKISREASIKGAIFKKSKKSLLNDNELFKKDSKLEVTKINKDKNNKQEVKVVELQKETKLLGTKKVAKLKNPTEAENVNTKKYINTNYKKIKDKKLKSNNEIVVEKTNEEMVKQDYEAKLSIIDKRMKFKKMEHGVAEKKIKKKVTKTKKTEFVNLIDKEDKNSELSENEAKLQKDGLFTLEEKFKISKMSEQSTVDTGRINAEETTKEFQLKFKKLQEKVQKKMVENKVNQNKKVPIITRSIKLEVGDKLKESDLVSQQNISLVLENENKCAKQLKASVAMSDVNNIPVPKEKGEPFTNNISIKQPETKTKSCLGRYVDEEIYEATISDISSDAESVFEILQNQIKNNNDSDSSTDSNNYNNIFLGN